MPRGPAGGLLAFLRRLPPAPDSDDDLLGRYVRGRDEPAFAALVARHGPMVFAACRRVLGTGTEAEDAFQAVFLALARDAGRIGTRAAVPGWLHRVAVRTARKLAARRRPSAPLPAEVGSALPSDAADRELLEALDGAVDALPEGLRAAVILCALEGRTNTEAAALLGCPVGTVDSRLHAAKQKLRSRLARRGFGLPAIGAALSALTLEMARAAEAAGRLAPAILAVCNGAPPSPAVAAILQEATVRTHYQLFAAVLVLAAAGVGFALNADADPPVPPPPLPAAGPKAPEAKPVTDAEYQNALVAAIHRLADEYGEADHLRALLERNPKLVNELVTDRERGKPSVTDNYTALHFAARRGNSGAVAVLIRYKADVNINAGGGWTSLHLAAQSGDLESVQLLVKAGAKVDAKTVPVAGGAGPGSPAAAPGGPSPPVFPAIPALTPLDLAKAGKHKDVVEYLSGLKR